MAIEVKMDVVNKIDRIINEASGAGTSYELMWNTIWNRSYYAILDPDTNEVVWSNSPAYPTGSFLTDDDIKKLQSHGYQILYRRKVAVPRTSPTFEY